MDIEPTYAQLKGKVQLLEEIFDQFMEHNPIYVFFKDENIRPIRLSRNYEHMLGMPIDEILGKTMDEIFPSDLAKSMTEDDKHVLKEGKIITVEEEFNGRFYETIKFPIFIEGKAKYLAGYTIDITERKLGQKALQESEEKFRTLIDQAADMLLVYDIGGNILDVNSKAIYEYGYSREELMDMNRSDLDPDYMDRETGREFWVHFNMNKPYRFETRQKRKDGTIFPVEASVTRVMIGDRPCLMGLYRDISEQESAKEKLESNIVFLKTLLDTIPNPIFYKDIEGRYMGGNRAFAEGILGIKTEEIIGHTAYELPIQISKQDADEHSFKNLALINTGGTQIYESKIKCNDHKNRDFIFYKSTFPNAEGDIAGIVGVMSDITDLKRGEEEKALLQQRLQQSQKMESIGTLAGGIAHDFNNILFPILAHSELAMMRLPSDSPVQQNIQQIHNAAERAKDLVRQILTFAKKQKDERIPIKISSILKETVKLLRSSIPSTISIRCEINVDHDIILADPTQINQIIMNLSTNAVHAMEEQGGSLEIIVSNEYLDSESAKNFIELDSGRYVKLSVTDTGHGILPELIDKIFEPYFTTKGPGKGTGMGLSIVHGIVKKHGGEITVQSKVNHGTTFHVYLPSIEADSNVLEVIQDSDQFPTGVEQILIVDDEKITVDTIQSMLEWLGYKVTSRTSSIEALEAFRYNPKGFDLVITDQTMPNMTGKNLAKELMSIRQDIPIILCTGFSEQIDERRAKEMGIRAFIMKPIVMGQIAKIIREVLDKK